MAGPHPVSATFQGSVSGNISKWTVTWSNGGTTDVRVDGTSDGGAAEQEAMDNAKILFPNGPPAQNAGQSSGDNSTGDDSTGDDSTGDDSTGDDSTGDDSTGDDSTGDDDSSDDSGGDDDSGGGSLRGPGSSGDFRIRPSVK
jgi:hypothetical protein